MSEPAKRPFYAEYAWAFDLLINRPVRKEGAAIASWLVERGILPGAEILDAGCGTGRVPIELARRGYTVHGIDLSPELVEVAKQSAGARARSASFAIGDIRVLPSRDAAILCRGVLNDIIEEDLRSAVSASFTAALRPSGGRSFDLRRSWYASVERKTREPRSESASQPNVVS